MKANSFAGAVILLALLAVMGCQQGNESGLSPQQEKMGNDVNAWAKATNGDWDKLNGSQKAAMIKSVGSEGSAKMVLKYAAHKPEAIAPGPPPGWKPGGPPPSHPSSAPPGN
jgi:hypothetical protein